MACSQRRKKQLASTTSGPVSHTVAFWNFDVYHLDCGQIGVLGRALNFPSIKDNLAQAKRTVEATPSPKSRYYGVRWHAWYKKWQAYIKLESLGPKKTKLGFFDLELVSELASLDFRLRV